MARAAPLRTTLRIDVNGDAGERRYYRLCREIADPPQVSFDGPLPLDGSGDGRVQFALPDGRTVEARARLSYDPRRPEQGSAAELLGLHSEPLQWVRGYIDDRSRRLAGDRGGAVE